jgi:hypothetical protein
MVGCVIYVVSGGLDYVTGQLLILDGGWAARLALGEFRHQCPLDLILRSRHIMVVQADDADQLIVFVYVVAG